MKASKRNKMNKEARDKKMKTKSKGTSKYAKKALNRKRGKPNPNSPIFLVTLLILLIAMIGCNKDPMGISEIENKMITVDLEDNGGIVNAAVGDTINIDLPTNHGSGYQWYFESQWDTLHLEYLGSNMNIMYYPERTNTGKRMLNITRKTTIIRFKVIGSGTSRIELVNFRYYESWKEFTVYPTFPYQLIINSF